MSFLRIEALWAIPLIVVPLIIHWLHRRRHPTMQWPAMMFLYQATKMRRGPAKLRRWIVLAIRVASVALIVLALARPLSQGVFGMAAGRIADTGTTVVLIDRSTGMQRRDAFGRSRQQRGLETVAETLRTLGVQTPVVIDSVDAQPIELASLESFNDGTLLKSADAPASIETMLASALDYLQEHESTLSDVWIVSDHASSSWNLQSSRWESIARQADSLGDGLRIHRFSFPQSSDQVNASVRLADLRWSSENLNRETSPQTGATLLFSVVVMEDQNLNAASATGSKKRTIPVDITVGTTTRTFDVTFRGGVGTLDNVPVDVNRQDDLYGSVSIPTDSNPADDQWYFTLSPPLQPSIGIISTQPCDALIAMGEVLGRVAFDQAGGAGQGTLETQDGSTERGDLPLDGIDCLWWQGPLPTGNAAEKLESFSSSGGNIVFFPPMQPDPKLQFQGTRWNEWVTLDPEETSYLGVKFIIESVCSVAGQAITECSTADGTNWLAQRQSDRGTTWFCGANVADHQSLFVRQGLGLFSVLAATVEQSDAASIRLHDYQAGHETAKQLRDLNASIKAVMSSDEETASRRGYHRGVYVVGEHEGKRHYIAINRSDVTTTRLSDEQIEAVLPGDYVNVVSIGASTTQPTSGAARELWGGLWFALIVGLLAEGWLSLSSRPTARTSGDDRT
ncbi:BatA domain-containing protein [Roseiconus lacunae]|uniref:BatA domain-containing protein n=1 Tax=Roseiconus lacunae TaxID=2605694 RepID=UPI001E4F1EFB|nr:BatA domain-containing protein [Roseiconus lacunae]MCD0458538.1 BatA domain-containing protein [Roseiconus lacunae]